MTSPAVEVLEAWTGIVIVIVDPERDEAALRLSNSASFQNALAAGGLVVLLAWPIGWLVGAVRRAVARGR